MRQRSVRGGSGVLMALALVGCGDGADSKGGGGTGTSSEPTWHADIAPLVQERCVTCHRAGGIAPFSLESYERAKMWSKQIVEATEDGTMPPFLAAETEDCKPRFGFKDDLRLSSQQKQLFADWSAARAPEGDAATAAALPKLPRLGLEDPLVDVGISEPVSIEGTKDRFVCFSLEPDYAALQADDRVIKLPDGRLLIDAAQVVPGNPKIVHHVLVYTDPDSESAALAGENGAYECFGGPGLADPGLAMAWAPGALPIHAPAGTAMLLPGKGRLVMQVHYHPTGGGMEEDRATSVQFTGYAGSFPRYIGGLTLIGNFADRDAEGFGLEPGEDGEVEFKIPANARDHVENMKFRLPTGFEARLWAIGSHMHYVGTDMHISITRSSPAKDDPEEECLLETPKWDFNWQRGYLYDTPIDEGPSLAGGDVLNLRCSYDNSMQNRFVASALAAQGQTKPHDVWLGEETLDEMCLGIFGFAQKVPGIP